MQRVTTEARTRCRGGRIVATSTDKVKLWTFNGSTFWAAYHCQFEAMASHIDCTSYEKAMYLPAILLGQGVAEDHGYYCHHRGSSSITNVGICQTGITYCKKLESISLD
jgi:hypothetical protein